MKRKLLLVSILTSALLGLSACAPNISPDTVSASNANDVQTAVEGVIVSKRTVTVKGDSNLLGTGIGALAGGVAGSTIGGGKGALLATIGGAVLGGAAGNAVEDKLQTQQGIEYVVRLAQQRSGTTTIKTKDADETLTTTVSSTSGSARYVTIVQGPGQQVLITGQKVLVAGVGGSHARIIALLN